MLYNDHHNSNLNAGKSKRCFSNQLKQISSHGSHKSLVFLTNNRKEKKISHFDLFAEASWRNDKLIFKDYALQFY
jgi:hypothetical protein